MFENALLDSSPRRASVLHRIHYLLTAFAGTLFFLQGLYLLPLVLAPAGARALFIAAAVLGSIAALYALMLCYVWADARQQHLSPWPWLSVTLLLNLPGFLIYLVYSAQKTGDWKRAAIPLAYVAEALLVGMLVLVPLIYTQALPRQLLISEIHISPPQGPPPAQPSGQPTKLPTHHTPVDPFTQPVSIPVGVKPVVEQLEPAEQPVGTGPWVIGALPPDPSDRSHNWVIGSPYGEKGPPPPPPVVHAAPKMQMVRVGGDVIAARALYQPPPVYPPLARMAHIQGVVVLQAIIGTNGAIQGLKVLSGPPLLAPAAIDAVKTWRYQPTLLNTEPVEVLTEIDVNFRLGE
jgi:periplasmic protein TonB